MKVLIEEQETHPSRTIAISAPDRVVEGEDIEVMLTNSDALNAGESIMVALDISANPTGFYDIAGTDSPVVSMTSASNTATFTISTNNRLAIDTNGMINISVVRGDQYEPASTLDEQVIIVASETLPSVSITRISPSSIDEGEDAGIFRFSIWSYF